MTGLDNIRLLESLKRELSPSFRMKLEPFKGVVVEVGSGAQAGMVRLRRSGLEASDVGRGFYAVIGTVPSVGAEVYAAGNFAGGYVFAGGGGGGSMTQATESALGGGELATQTETNTGTDDTRIVTPLKLKNSTSLDSRYVNESDHTAAAHNSLNIDHGSLSGLADDDHTQYLNNTRGDARYAPVGLIQRPVVGETYTQYNITLAANTWTRLNDGTNNRPQINVPALPTAPTGLSWHLMVWGVLRVQPPAAANINLGAQLDNGAMAAVQGGGYIGASTVIAAMALSQYLADVSAGVTHTVDFAIHATAAGSYTVANARPTAVAFLAPSS